MDKYYYIVAQLPLLSFGKPSSMTLSAFLAETGKWLLPRDQAFLSGVRFTDMRLHQKGPGAWRAYRHFEHKFREEIGLWRQSQKNGDEYKPSIFPLSLVQEGNPLDVEKKLLKWRWRFIEAMEKEHHFDLTWLVLYFLKLQILERMSLFDREKGLEVFQELIQAALEEDQTGEADTSAEETDRISASIESSLI